MVAQNSAPTVAAGLAARGQVPANVAFAATSLYALVNGYIDVAVAGNALTASVKTLAGTDPTPLNPVFGAFRSATAASGLLTVRAITAAVTLTIPQGATTGFTANDPSRLWFQLLDVGDGTVKLAARNCSTSAGKIFPLAEFGLATTVLADTSADSAGVSYASSVLTARPFRIVGFADWNSGLAVPGTWASSPGRVQLFGSGLHKPGDVVQTVINSRTDVVEGSTVIPTDDTIPQISEGDQYFSTPITPISAINFVENEYELRYSNNSGSGLANAAALFRGAGVNAIDVAWAFLFNTNVPDTLHGRFRERAASAAEITYSIRAGGGGSTGSGGLDFILNGTAVAGAIARWYGGAMSSRHVVSEIMA